MITKIYIFYFFTADCVTKAPQIDVNLLKKIEKLKSSNEQLYCQVGKKLEKHLWYLSPQNVCFALFDQNVSHKEKEKMAQNIMHKDGGNMRAFKADLTKMDRECATLTLTDFCDKNSKEFFNILEIDSEFLKYPAHKWDNIDGYKMGKKKVMSIHSVNDVAERAIKVAQDYNRTLTNKNSMYEKICINAYETRKKHKKTPK